MFAGGNGNFTATNAGSDGLHQGLSPFPREWRSQQIRFIDISRDVTYPYLCTRYRPPAKNWGIPGRHSNPITHPSATKFSPFLNSRDPEGSHGTVMSGIRTRLPVRAGREQGRRLSRCPWDLVKHILIPICNRIRSACLPVPDLNL